MSESMLIALLGSTLLTTVVTTIGTITIWCLNRRASKVDKKHSDEDKLEMLVEKLNDHERLNHEQLSKLNEILNQSITTEVVLKDAMCRIVRHMILRIYYRYLPWEALPTYERENLSQLCDIYIHGLEGNSFINDIKPEMDTWKTVEDIHYFTEDNKVIK